MNVVIASDDDDNNNNDDARSIVDKVYLHIHKLLHSLTYFVDTHIFFII
jgi:hypothetical protein